MFTLTRVGSKKKCEEDCDECLPTHVSLLYLGPIEGGPLRLKVSTGDLCLLAMFGQNREPLC